MARINPSDSLVEEREAELVSFDGPQRKGLFLNPTASSPSSSSSVDDGGGEDEYAIFIHHHHPTLSSSSTTPPKPPNFHPKFKWWADPQPQWPLWVDKLKPLYSHIWLKTGIFDAIMASNIVIRRDPASLLGLSTFWSKGTSTFIFPWAEATLTLEDVMILGGFPVLGEPVRMKRPLEGVTGHMVSKMTDELNTHFRRKGVKSEQSAWMKHYLEVGKGDEIEHIALLSLWLSRFVLVGGDGSCIRDPVFQVAVRLASGTRIALAPAVLASIYRDLQTVKGHASGNAQSLPPLAVWSAFNLLQTWVWERFPAISPESRDLSSPDMPRVARWNNTGEMHVLPYVMQVLESPSEFHWRPYAIELMNWRKPSFYLNEGKWLHDVMSQDEGLQSFARCLRACELVGLDCIEQYQPQRVARQFSLDQDIPKSLPRANTTWEIAWRTYDAGSKSIRFCVPSQHSESAVTLQYSNWWRDTKLKALRTREKRKESSPLPNGKKKKAKVFDETKRPACPALSAHGIFSRKSICSDFHEEQACAVTPLHTKLNKSLEGSETNQNSDVVKETKVSENKEEEAPGATIVNEARITEIVQKTDARGLDHDLKAIEQSKKETETQLKDEPPPEALCANDKNTAVTNVTEFEHEPTVVVKPVAKRKRVDVPGIEESDPVVKEELEHQSKSKREEMQENEERDPTRKEELDCQSKCKREETQEIEERDPARKKELDRDMKIKLLKEDIASIMKQIRYWESLSEAHPN